MTTPVYEAFLQLAIARGVLKFGEFTLKSGRISPYFFNAGMFDQGSDLATLGDCYAATLAESNVDFDILFGPAYKGIPLASITAAALYRNHGQDVAYAFNRKEAKDHGEGGNIVGRPLAGKVAIIDDVITAGTAIRESMDIISAAGAEPACVLIALDRQEKSGTSDRSAVQEVEDQYGIPVISIATLAQLKHMLSEQGQSETVNAMQSYQNQYGI